MEFANQPVATDVAVLGAAMELAAVMPAVVVLAAIQETPAAARAAVLPGESAATAVVAAAPAVLTKMTRNAAGWARNAVQIHSQVLTAATMMKLAAQKPYLT
jgi:hypothetical protein